MTAPSPVPRRISPPSWLDLRLLVGVAMVAGAVVLGAVVVARAERTAPAVVATRDLAAGTVLTASDLAVVRVRLTSTTATAYATRTGMLVGRQLGHAVGAGELVPLAATTRSAPGTTITVPFGVGAAPPLHAGQRIEIWFSTPTCRSVMSVPDVTVQAVSGRDAGFGSSDGQDVVLRVPPALAERVVGALDMDQGRLRAGVLNGVPAPDPAAALPDLDACAPAR
jgi:hypothetical protein